MMFHKNKYKQNTYNSAPTTFCLLGENKMLKKKSHKSISNTKNNTIL